jgi:hypothetical protein
MPTYPSPVTVPAFQLYLNDLSGDPTILGFFQTLLDTATERVYTYLDLDFTANAAKNEVFTGNDTDYFRLHQPASSITTWIATDLDGVATPQSIAPLHLFENGMLLVNSQGTFASGYEHSFSYKTPVSLTCPETVRQVITEIAAVMLRESKQGAGSLSKAIDMYRDTASLARSEFIELDDRHRAMLSPYKRYAV